MAPYFSAEHLVQLEEGLKGIQGKHDDLLHSYTTHDFSTTEGEEFAHHGLVRRIGVMARCIVAIFQALPPENTELPPDYRVIDATIALQSFIFNLSGAIDNLAWVLVKERRITDRDKPLPATFVGLRSKNKVVRNALSDDFRASLTEFENWFNYVDSYRHSLAHRIPLYIPPHCVDPKNAAAYQDLERRHQEALRRRDVNLHDRLLAEQANLTFFRPWMKHSFSEEARPVAFHAQVIADFLSIEELAWLTLKEIGGTRKSIPFRHLVSRN